MEPQPSYANSVDAANYRSADYFHLTGKYNEEFDLRMENIKALNHEPVYEPELESEVARLCDWINSDSRVRRNLNAARYVDILTFRSCLPDHPVWDKVEMMLRTRRAKNSFARKNLLKEQREAAAASR